MRPRSTTPHPADAVFVATASFDPAPSIDPSSAGDVPSPPRPGPVRGKTRIPEEADGGRSPAGPVHDGVLSPPVYREIVECCADTIVVINADHTIRYVNRAAEAMFRRPREAFIGKPLDILIPPRLSARHAAHVEAFRDGAEPARYMGSRTGAMSAVRATGEEFPVAISIVRVHDGQGLYMAALIRDVTERRTLEDELMRLACTDPLTGALNRRAFIGRAEEERDRSIRYGYPLAVAVVDADHFKAINDDYGHGIGDEALKHIVQVISTELRATDALGRWGGEEFILLLPHTDADAAARTAERLRRKVVGAPLVGVCDRGPVPLAVSIGVAELDPDEDTVGTLIQRADQALYSAKSGGRNQVVVVPNRPKGTLLA